MESLTQREAKNASDLHGKSNQMIVKEEDDEKNTQASHVQRKRTKSLNAELIGATWDGSNAQNEWKNPGDLLKLMFRIEVWYEIHITLAFF